MKIFYAGEQSGTSLHRANALSRLGHEVEICSPTPFLPSNPLFRRLHWETGALFIGNHIDDCIIRRMGDRTFDVLWVDHGRYTGRNLVRHAKSKGMKTVVLNVDDPFGYRDRFSWLQYRKTVKEYDLTVVVRDPNIDEAKKHGAKDVMKVWRSADEVAHSPRDLTPEEEEKYSSEVLFLGTWMVGRGAFMKELVDQGVPVTIIGDRWNRAPEWNAIKDYWKAPGVYNEVEYAAYIQCAKVSLGLLSVQNRDLITTRSAEIPAIGSLFCAERTSEHLELYEDGVEAVFWDDAQECALRCKELLRDPERRMAIAKAGHDRCYKNGTMNEPVMKSVLDRLMSGTSSA